MADIIDICDRLRRGAQQKTRIEGCATVRIRLCGPDLRWLGLVGGVLAEALAAANFQSSLNEMKISIGLSPVLDLSAGREYVAEAGAAPAPGLVVDATGVAFAALHGCNSRTVLLTHNVQGRQLALGRLAFPGTELPLPLSDPTSGPLEIALACVGGAACLLGTVRWDVLQQAISEELTLCSGRPVEPYLALAFEAFHRLAPWSGLVQSRQEDFS